MEVTQLTRAFVFNGIELVDPSATLTPDQVKEFYAVTYPDLANADVEGPERKGERDVYTFRRAVGTKGAEAPDVQVYTFTRQELVAAFARWDSILTSTKAEADAYWATRPKHEMDEACADHLIKALTA